MNKRGLIGQTLEVFLKEQVKVLEETPFI